MLKQVLTLSAGSAIGKLFGVVREILFAAFFGTSATADAYRAAITATFAPIHLFASEALNATFIPQFCKDREERETSAWSLFNGIGLLLFIISLIVGSTLYFFAPRWISLLLPGFTGIRFKLAVQMLKIMAWGVPLYILSAMWISLEIGSGQFRLAAFRPFAQNLGIIAALTVAYFGAQPVWIAWGFTGTYVFYSLFGAARLIQRGILERGWYRHWNNLRPVAKRFWNAMKPMAFFSVLVQTNILIEKAIASLIGPGAVAAVDYAKMIPETALVLLIVPLGLVSLSAMVNLNENEVLERCDRISTTVLLLLVPLSGFILVSALDLVKLIYQRGAFDEASVVLTSQVLRGMSIGMWAVCIAYVMQKVYNARLRNREVLRIGAMGIIGNILFNVIAYRYLGVLAIGLGFSLSGMIMAWFYVRDIGEMKTMWQIARLCFYGIIPYFLIALLLNKQISSSPLVILTVQAIWSMVFWGCLFLSAPTSREILIQLAQKTISMRGR